MLKKIAFSLCVSSIACSTIQAMNIVKRIHDWRCSSTERFANAMLTVGDIYVHGVHLQRNYIKAFKCFQVAAQLGNQHAIDRLQSSVMDIIGAAYRGDKHSQYCLGLLYMFGTYAPKNELKARKWYKKSAKQDHAEAKNELAFCDSCESSQPLSQPMKISACDPHAIAQIREITGSNVSRRDAIDAIFMVGKSYFDGVGISQDCVKAFKYFSIAANFQRGEATEYLQSSIVAIIAKAYSGDVTAQYHLGQLYSLGHYMPLNDIRAIKWHKKAAKQKHATAAYNVGLLYATSDYYRRHSDNIVKAKKWYTIARDLGSIDARRVLVALGDI